MEPYVRLGTAVNGPDHTPVNQELGLYSSEERRSASANLIQNMLCSDPMLFIRGDEAEELWRIIDPIVTAWSNDEVPLETYPAGSRCDALA